MKSKWAASSVGRAPRSQRGGRGFDPHAVHHFPEINNYEVTKSRRLLSECCSKDGLGDHFSLSIPTPLPLGLRASGEAAYLTMVTSPR